MSHWKWSLIAVVPFLGWLLLQLSGLESRVDALSDAVARLESREPVVAPAPRRQQVVVVQPDGGVLRLSGPTGGPQAGPGQRAQPAGTAVADGKDERERILDVVTREQDRIAERHLEFHAGRWMEAREEALSDLAEKAQLSPVQNSRLADLVRDEVDHMKQMLREPRYRDDPEGFVQEWERTLNATDHAANSFLDPEQQEVWAVARGIERAVFFPWLPK